MGKKLFWSRDRLLLLLVKHEFDCFGLGLGFRLGLIMVRVMNSFGVMVKVRVGIWMYVKPFCSAAKP